MEGFRRAGTPVANATGIAGDRHRSSESSAANGGLSYVGTNPRYLERFAEYLQSAPVTRRARCVTRIGWHGDTFVLPDIANGPAEVEETIYQPPHEAIHYWTTQGTASEWRDAVGRLCSGNSRLIIAVARGFGGALLSLVGAESGGSQGTRTLA